MNTGVDRRAQIDAESVKALILINGAGSIALLAFLPHVLAAVPFRPLTVAILWALLLYQVGLIFAIVHNRLRRKCSLAYDEAASGSPSVRPDPCEWRWLAWISPEEAYVCCGSILFFYLSLGAFILAGVIVAVGGFRVI